MGQSRLRLDCTFGVQRQPWIQGLESPKAFPIIMACYPYFTGLQPTSNLIAKVVVWLDVLPISLSCLRACGEQAGGSNTF